MLKNVLLVQEQASNIYNKKRVATNKSYRYANLINDRGGILNWQEKEGQFNKWCWDNWIPF